MIGCLRPIHQKSVGTFSTNLLAEPNRSNARHSTTHCDAGHILRARILPDHHQIHGPVKSLQEQSQQDRQ